MDGTIIDSTPAIIKHWQKLAKQLHVDPEEILHSSHGRRSIDTLALYDKSLANWEYVSHVEGQIPKEYGQDAKEVPGARALLESLDKKGVPWAIVTSGTRPLIQGWLDVIKLPFPQNLVVAEDVEQGKPDPQCYLLGHRKLDMEPDSRMLVLEDAPSGVKAGKAAGFTVVALATTHDTARLREAGADWIVRDMESVQLQEWNGARAQATVQISQALR
ncbi:MAG: hypothetical protein Q9159_005888 [Coniocarpon cinnabarinum]